MAEQIFYRIHSLGAPVDSLGTVLLLPKPWLWFSTRTSSVAELDLHLVAFKRNFTFLFFFCSLLWREPFCLTEYLRGRSKIIVFRNQLRIRSEHFDPLLLGVCFIGTHFLKIHPSFFFSGRVPGLL